MSQYCHNCGALNTSDQVRCSGCMTLLQKQDQSHSQAPQPPWSQAPHAVKPQSQIPSHAMPKQSIPVFHPSVPVPRSSIPVPSSSPSPYLSQPPTHRQASSTPRVVATEMLASLPPNTLSQSQSQSQSHSSVTMNQSDQYSIPSSSNDSHVSQSTARSLWSQQVEVLNITPTPATASTPVSNSQSSHIPRISSVSVKQPSIRPSSVSLNLPTTSRAPSHSISPITEEIDSLSRTLAPERLAQLYETPQVFLFGGADAIDQYSIKDQSLWDRTRELLSLCEPLITDQVNEASIFIAFELPPRSWLQALHDLRPDGEVLVWLSQWPEGKTGQQLHEGKTSAFFYGEEGLIELAVTLYRLAPFSLENKNLDTWWSQVQLRACLVEVEHFQRLLLQSQVDTYLVTLFAQRMRRWARVSRDPLWTQIAESSHHLSNHLSQAGNHIQLQAAQEVLTLSEELLKHELLKRSKTLTHLKVACLSQLKIDHPQLIELLSAFGAQLAWFKHPQALLNKVNSEHFHWCFLSEYAGPWDGFDLVQEVKARAQNIQVAVSVLSRRTHILARAQHLSVDVLLYPNEALADQVITLNQVFNHKLSTKHGVQDVYKRLNAIQNAQNSQGLPQRTGLLLLQSKEEPWLPIWLARLDSIRQSVMPKSLSYVLLDDRTVAFPLALDQDEPVRAFCDQVVADIKIDMAAGCVLNQGSRAPEGMVSDVWLRLQWAQEHRMLLSIGWWKSERHYERQLNVHGAQILIVDSDPTSLDLLRFFCEKSGLIVSVLQDGQAAIDLLEKLQYPPQLIVAECMLPYTNGFQVLEAAQKLKSGKPRTILCSAIKRDELIEKAFAMGACDFVYKPFNMTEVMARIMHALS